MNRSSLAALATLAALVFAATTAGCSQPDVAGFQGSNASRSADDDDDDSSATTTKETKSAKGTPTNTGETPPTTTTPAPTTTTTPAATTPAPTTTTPQACFTHCVSPVPEAAAFDACSLKCAETDNACIDACYDSSKCAASSLCDTALTQCGHKCPPPS